METQVCKNTCLFLRKLNVAPCQFLPPLKRVDIPINEIHENFSPMPHVEKSNLRVNEEIMKKDTLA